MDRINSYMEVPIMNDYRKDIIDIWQSIGIIKENIKRIEAKLQDRLIEDSAIEYQYGATPTAVPPKVPSTQACSATYEAEKHH